MEHLRVFNIAALTALPKAGWGDGQQVTVLYYATINDGGGGTFWWNLGSSTAADGGSVFAPDEGGTGRWKRVDQHGDIRINARWFGAKGDGVTDDFTAITNAIKGANERRIAEGLNAVVVYFPEGHYTVSSGVPLTYATYLTTDLRWGATLTCTGATATIYSATYAAGVFTDNLDATLSEVNSGASASGAGVINLYVQQTGTITGNAPSGEPWSATIQLVGCPDVLILNVNCSNETTGKNGLFLKYCWRARVDNFYCPRGDTFTGGIGIAIDSQSNAMLVDHPFVFGNWATGIEVGGPNSVTILEANVEFSDVGVRLGGVSPRVIGGYFEGNTIDIQLGMSPTAPVIGAYVERTWHNGSSTDYGIDIQAATDSLIIRPRFTGTYNVSQFKSNSDVTNNLGNLIEYGTVSDTTTFNLGTYGLSGGRNILRVYGDTDDNHTFYTEYQTRNGRRIETELNQRGAQFVCFEAKLINSAGTLQIAIQDGDEVSTTYDACFVAGASATPVTIPDVSSGVGFGSAAGGRLTGSLNVIVLNTNGSVGATQSFIAGAVFTNNGTALTVSVRPKSRNINGATNTRPEITIANAASGAAFNFDTTNFTSGEYLRVPLLGFIS